MLAKSRTRQLKKIIKLYKNGVIDKLHNTKNTEEY